MLARNLDGFWGRTEALEVFWYLVVSNASVHSRMHSASCYQLRPVFLCKDDLSGAKISWTCSPAFLVSFAVSDPLELAQGPCPTIQKWTCHIPLSTCWLGSCWEILSEHVWFSVLKKLHLFQCFVRGPMWCQGRDANGGCEAWGLAEWGGLFARAVWQVYTVLTLASKTSISTVAVSKQL